MLFVGDDWAEDHHDVYLMDEAGALLAAQRLPEGLAGIGQFHELIAAHADDPGEVVVGIEKDHGLWVGVLAASGYQVYAINPMAVARYRDRHRLSGAKSDAADAKLLADLVRTDRHNHRPLDGDSAQSEAIQVLAIPSKPDLDPGRPGRLAAQRFAGVLPGRVAGFHQSRRPRSRS